MSAKEILTELVLSEEALKECRRKSKAARKPSQALADEYSAALARCAAAKEAAKRFVHPPAPEWKKPSMKAYREHLNTEELLYGTGDKHVNGRYHQVKRKYGDYLYFQDREKFNVDYEEWCTALQLESAGPAN